MKTKNWQEAVDTMRYSITQGCEEAVEELVGIDSFSDTPEEIGEIMQQFVDDVNKYAEDRLAYYESEINVL